MNKQVQFKLGRQELGALPIIEHILGRIDLRDSLVSAMGNDRYADAILVLLKNILVDRQALYAIEEWVRPFDPGLIKCMGIGDDVIARALSRLFEIDRASLLTRIVLGVIQKFAINVGEIHQDTTSVKLYGAYANQRTRAVQFKRGHSKDHRPDLKQLVYELSVTQDGAIPILFKSHDGNLSDDSFHWDTWQALRGIAGKADFLYVADSKLCVSQTLLKIDREKGRFVTIVPRTREEVSLFADQILSGRVRWERLCVKRSTRHANRMDQIDVAEGLYQLREGFRLYWFRSSEKTKRDLEKREERIELAMERLRAFDEPGRRGPRTQAALKRRAEKILARFKVSEWITIDIALERVEDFKQKARGRATENTDYRRVIKWIPRLSVCRNPSGIAKSAAMDGIFPLTTNTELKPIAVLNAYKFQPKLEKRHAMLKSGFHVSPVFLKKNDRIEALMAVFFLAQLAAALLEREIHKGMVEQGVEAIQILPEERSSRHPTAEQVFRVFASRAKHVLRTPGSRQPLQTFTDPLTPVQKQVLNLLNIKHSAYA